MDGVGVAEGFQGLIKPVENGHAVNLPAPEMGDYYFLKVWDM
jgi:hypothetical protein